jgi:WD40 repeat protein
MIDPKNLKQLSHWSCQDIVFALAASQDGRRLWLGSSDAGVYEFDLTAEKPERVKLTGDGHSSYVTSMVRCGNVLVSASYDRRLIWWDLETQSQIRSTSAHDKWIRHVVATQDQRRVISVADDMQCRVWDVATGQLVAEFSDHAQQTPHHYPSMLYAVAVSPDGSQIATGDRIGHVAIWDASTFKKVFEVEAPRMYTWDPKQRRHSIGGIRSLAFSPEGNRLAVGGIGKIGNIDHLGGPARLEIFDLQTGDRQLEIEDNKKKGLIEQIIWPADQDWIMTVGGDHNGFITFYDATSGEKIHQDGQGGHVHAAVPVADFASIFVAAHQRVSHWTLSASDESSE